jgi:hypothetical protein
MASLKILSKRHAYSVTAKGEAATHGRRFEYCRNRATGRAARDHEEVDAKLRRSARLLNTPATSTWSAVGPLLMKLGAVQHVRHVNHLVRRGALSYG